MSQDDHPQDPVVAPEAPLTIELCADSGTIRIRRSTVRGTDTKTVER